MRKFAECANLRTVLTEKDIRSLLKAACENAGSVKAWARSKGLAWSSVYDAVDGEPLRPKLLAALGYRRVILYEEATE